MWLQTVMKPHFLRVGLDKNEDYQDPFHTFQGLLQFDVFAAKWKKRCYPGETTVETLCINYSIIGPTELHCRALFHGASNQKEHEN